MTKAAVEPSKTKKTSSKTAIDPRGSVESKKEEEPMENIVNGELSGGGSNDEEGSTDDESGEEVGNEEEEDASGDSDQVLATALDTVLKQAQEGNVVIPEKKGEENKPKFNPAGEHTDGDTSMRSALDITLGGSTPEAASDKENRGTKRKLEGSKKKMSGVKLTRSGRDKVKARVTEEVAALAAANVIEQLKGAPTYQKDRIPRVSPSRIRQRKAVAQTKQRGGITTKYEKLSNLLDLYRLLQKGNPFPLIDPKQAYPHIYQVPGINSTVMQPLIKQWQEKATRVLYQLLIIETKCDIARLKKRSALFMAEPATFVDAFKLKVDMGLEIDQPKISTNQKTGPVKQKSESQAIQPSMGNKAGTSGHPPPLKRAKKVSD